MTIPKEAVDAAVDAMSGVNAYDLRALATDILEVAEPYIAAAAWDQAIQDTDDEGYIYAHHSEAMKARNPYRSTP